MDSDSTQNAQSWTVRDLRRRWKPTKERLAGEPAHESFLIRIHRSCSWLQRVEELQAEDGPLDAILIFQWTALNSLYGRWDPAACHPMTDRDTLPAFLDRLLDLDQGAHVTGALKKHRRLVMAIFDDTYLTAHFWEKPSVERGRKNTKTKFDAQTWYHEGRHKLILDRLMERIYFLRCQLVHGGATFGGRLNRTAVRRCSTMLGHLIPATLLVLIDRGYDEDWGLLCYPPQK